MLQRCWSESDNIYLFYLKFKSAHDVLHGAFSVAAESEFVLLIEHKQWDSKYESNLTKIGFAAISNRDFSFKFVMFYLLQCLNSVLFCGHVC